jgi:ABC-type sugar transport system ATPase subunit
VNEPCEAGAALSTPAQLGLSLDPGIRINQLSYAERQLIAIAKALRRRCKVVILDEHTAALEVREVGVVGEPGRNREVV